MPVLINLIEEEGIHTVTQQFDVDQLRDLRAAGKSTLRQQLQSQKPSKPKAVDLSLLQPGLCKDERSIRIDPSHIEASAGYMKPSEAPVTGVMRIPEADTDPITHFKHLGLNFKKKQEKPGKRMGFEHGAAQQTWTWQQELQKTKLNKEEKAQLQAEMQRNISKKFAVGADGNRYYNMFGVEDMLPAASRTYIKCDRPAGQEHIVKNDQIHLPYCLREGPGTRKRPVHDYWRSDRIWSVLAYQEDNAPDRATFAKKRVHEFDHHKDVMAGMEVRRRLTPSPHGKRVDGFDTEALRGNLRDISLQPHDVDDEDDELVWRVLPPSPKGNHKVPHWPHKERGRNQVGCLITFDGQMPRAVSAGPSLSMTPQNVRRLDASPRSMTPRSVNARDLSPRSLTPRSSVEAPSMQPSVSAPQFAPAMRGAAGQGDASARSMTPPRGERDAAARSMTPRGERGASARSMTPRGERNASARSMTPRGEREASPMTRALEQKAMSRGNVTPRGTTTPRSMTPRGSATLRGEAALSMTPQLISRRDPSPRGTPRGSPR